MKPIEMSKAAELLTQAQQAIRDLQRDRSGENRPPTDPEILRILDLLSNTNEQTLSALTHLSDMLEQEKA
jgi:hypothetical protein